MCVYFAMTNSFSYEMGIYCIWSRNDIWLDYAAKFSNASGKYNNDWMQSWYYGTNLESIPGSWKNSHESLGPKLIKEPISVADNANNCKMVIESIRKDTVLTTCAQV